MENPKRILLIDDEKNFLEIFSLELQAAGFEIDVALSGEEGIAKLKMRKPDLVLLDMEMPGLSGADVMLTLRDDPDAKDVKVVFLSGVGLPEKKEQDIRHARSIGALGYIEKTEEMSKILEEVRSYL